MSRLFPNRASSGPSSTFCRTKLLFAAGATHASIIAIAILRQGELIVAHPRTNGSVGRVGLIDLRIHRGLRGLNHGLDGAIAMFVWAARRRIHRSRARCRPSMLEAAQP